MTARQVIRIFGIDQPRCSRTYGVSPCTAAIGVTGTAKCFNGRASCQDTANIDLSETVSLRFTEPQDGIEQYGPFIPSLVNVTTSPLAVNLGGMTKSAAALGRRETVSVTLKDHPYSDHLVDKYRLERQAGTAGTTYTPYLRGSFWGKWLARNPYYASYNCWVREGYVGDAFEKLRVRYYVLDSIDGPTDGMVSARATDLFSLIEKRKAKAPFASTGRLSADLTGAPATFTLTPAGIGSLAPSSGGYSTITNVTQGRLAIGKEILLVTRVGDVFTVVARADLNTTQEDHKQDDAAQLVLAYSVTAPKDLIYDLLVTYSTLPAAKIPTADWTTATASNTDFFSGYVAKPTPVEQLIGEIEEQAALTVWPDVSTGLINIRLLRASATIATVDDNAFILDKSLKITRAEDKRISQVWFYYGKVNPLESDDDPKNYRSRLVVTTGKATIYGTDSIREVFSRWVPQGGRTIASRAANRISAMFADPPVEASFSSTVERAGTVDVADYIDFKPFELQDVTGAQASVRAAITEVERSEDAFRFKAQAVAFAADDDGVRRVYIENTGLYNINLRTLHDNVFPAPTGSEVIEFTIVAGINVGSTSNTTPAVTTGSWPTMTTKPKLIFANPGTAAKARIQGKAGRGAQGGGWAGGVGSNMSAAQAGENGGPALEVLAAFTVDRTYAEIWSGGGSGGAGGALYYTPPDDMFGGGSSGGAAGNPSGPGSAAGVSNSLDGSYPLATGGAPGSTEAAGASGTGARSTGTWRAGNAGASGSPGQDGTAGESGQPGTLPVTDYTVGSGGAAGLKGNYIVGNALVTWIGTGDCRGGVA